MNTTFTGWFAAAGAFLAVLFLGSGFLGPLFGVLGAVGAGYYTWKHFDDKYKSELNALLNPPAELWALPMPEAWTCLKDVLASAHVESGMNGISNWRIQQEDNTRGIIQAQLNFQQMLGSTTQSVIVPRSVTMNAQLSPEGDGTKVEIHYLIFSPSGTGLVESVVKTTQAEMKQRVAIGTRG